MLMILMNLQAAPKENAGALGADLDCESGSVALCARGSEDGAALVRKMNSYISWQERRGGEMELSLKRFPPSLQSARKFVEEAGWLCV